VWGGPWTSSLILCAMEWSCPCPLPLLVRWGLRVIPGAYIPDQHSSRLKQCEVCKIVVKFCCVELTWGFVLISDTTMHTCCAEKNTNISINGDDDYLPSETGNLTITYDITQAYEGNYWALVCTHSCSLRSHFFWTPTWCFILEPILGFDY